MVQLRKQPKKAAGKKKAPAKKTLLRYEVDGDHTLYKEPDAVFRLLRVEGGKSSKSGKVAYVDQLVCPVCLQNDNDDNWYCQACMVTAHRDCMKQDTYKHLHQDGACRICNSCLSAD